MPQTQLWKVVLVLFTLTRYHAYPLNEVGAQIFRETLFDKVVVADNFWGSLVLKGVADLRQRKLTGTKAYWRKVIGTIKSFLFWRYRYCQEQNTDLVNIYECVCFRLCLGFRFCGPYRGAGARDAWSWKVYGKVHRPAYLITKLLIYKICDIKIYARPKLSRSVFI